MALAFRWIKFVVFSAWLLTACGDVDGSYHEPSPDGADDLALSGGKADELFGECHKVHILLLLNDPGSDADSLSDRGVHRRAARNIADHRGGGRYFTTIFDVDAVPYVGPVAMQQLAAAVDSYCDGPSPPPEAYFSPRPYGDDFMAAVVDKIDGAERSVDMAIYGLSDHRVISALGAAVDRGVEVRMLYDGANGDHLRTAGSTSARLEDRGVNVRYINRSMHHKFAIVDGPQDYLLQASRARFFSGSANLTYLSVTKYDENMILHSGGEPSLVLTMQREFNHLWENSRNLEWNDDLEYVETLSIEEAMIPDVGGLEVLLTSENFETTYSERWGSGFRPIEFSEVVASRLIELIEGARASIYVAARYLRSPRIAEAIIERSRQVPDLDIRVYVDQTEYLSSEEHEDQQRELAGCLDGANDEGDQFDCRKSGRRFSFALHEQGISVRFKTYAYRWHVSYAAQMHHKYLIIDEEILATGSYNLSNNSERNSMENVVVYHGWRYPELVDDYVANFEGIWETGRPHNQLEELADAEVIDLVFSPLALSWEELTELRRIIRQRCPEVDSPAYRQRPEEHQNCVAR